MADTLFRGLVPVSLVLCIATLWDVRFAYAAVPVLLCMLTLLIVSIVQHMRRLR